MGKLHKLPFTAFAHSYSTPLELIYTDVWGPAPIKSNAGTITMFALLMPSPNICVYTY